VFHAISSPISYPWGFLCNLFVYSLIDDCPILWVIECLLFCGGWVRCFRVQGWWLMFFRLPSGWLVVSFCSSPLLSCGYLYPELNTGLPHQVAPRQFKPASLPTSPPNPLLLLSLLLIPHVCLHQLLLLLHHCSFLLLWRWWILWAHPSRGYGCFWGGSPSRPWFVSPWSGLPYYSWGWGIFSCWAWCFYWAVIAQTCSWWSNGMGGMWTSNWLELTLPSLAHSPPFWK